jgi:microcystin-dependent protein
MGTTPFMGEIDINSFNFAPKGWAQCNGQFLPINQNQALFSILGTTFGGNGQTTFALPDLRGRCAMYTGNGHTIGEAGGQEFHTVTISEMPQHVHIMSGNNGQADTAATAVTPAGNSFATAFAVPAGGGSVAVNRFSTAGANGALAPAAITNTGGSQPHENRQPFTVLNFCIALQGIFPSRN